MRKFAVICTLILAGCGPSKQDTHSVPKTAESATVPTTAQTVQVVGPTHPELVSMEWDQVLIYTLSNNIPPDGYLLHIRDGIKQDSKFEKLQKASKLLQGQFGPYKPLIVAALLERVEREPVVSRNRLSAELFGAVLPDSAESLVATQVLWAGYQTRRQYASMLDYLVRVSETPTKKESLWVWDEALKLRVLVGEPTWNRLLATRNAALPQTHKMFVSIPSDTVPLSARLLEQDMLWEMSLGDTEQGLVRNSEDVLAGIANGMPAWQRLRMLNSRLERYYVTGQVLRAKPMQRLAFSFQSETELRAVRDNLLPLLK